MPTYTVVMVHDALTAVEIEAINSEEAAALAMEMDEASPILCHQCSCNLELGGVVKVIVEDQQTGEEEEVDV